MVHDLKDADTLSLSALLADQASRFCNAPRDQKAMTIVVNDWEYLYDTVRHDQYRHSEGEGSERKIRCPFHRIVAGAWAIIDFPADGALPMVRRIEVLDSRVGDEVEIVKRYFAALGTCAKERSRKSDCYFNGTTKPASPDPPRGHRW